MTPECDEFGWLIRMRGETRVCARPTCTAGPFGTPSEEFRIDGHCSEYCRDMYDAEQERDAARAELAAHLAWGHPQVLSEQLKACRQFEASFEKSWREAADENATLRAKLAEAERERDEARAERNDLLPIADTAGFYMETANRALQRASVAERELADAKDLCAHLDEWLLEFGTIEALRSRLAASERAAEALRRLEEWLQKTEMRTATLSIGPCGSMSISLTEYTIHPDPDAYPSVEEWAVTEQSPFPAALLSALDQAAGEGRETNRAD